MYFLSFSSVMLVSCSELNTLCVYLTHLLNVHTGDTLSNSRRLHTKIAQAPVASVTCCAHSAVSLSRDARDVVVWDIESCTIKVQVHCTEKVQQYCLSLTETHLAVVTESGKVMLYAVESVDEDQSFRGEAAIGTKNNENTKIILLYAEKNHS